MSVSLVKNQKVSLTKEAPTLSNIFVGLGWDPVKKGGLFGSMFGGGDGSIDLDASCMMFDSNKQLVDTVWFRQLKSKDGSVTHSGDNLTGEGDGDDEKIHVDLNRLPANVTALVFVITSFRGQTFDKVASAFCRLVNKANNTEMVKYTLSDKSKNTAQIMVKLSKEGNEWVAQGIGEPADGTVQSQLIPVVQRFL